MSGRQLLEVWRLNWYNKGVLGQLHQYLMGYSLLELRRVYLALLVRTEHACAAVEQARSKRVWLDAQKVVQDVALHLSAVSDSGDVEELEDLEQSLLEDAMSAQISAAEGVFREKHEASGTSCFVLRPVLGRLGLFSHLKPWSFSYLSGYDSQWAVLDSTARPERLALEEFLACEEPPQGLAPFEEDALRQDYLRKCCRILSGLRHLRTGLTYVRKGLAAGALQASVVVAVEEGIVEAVDSAYALTYFASFEPAAESFSSGSSWSRGSDDINTIRELPKDKEAFFAELGIALA